MSALFRQMLVILLILLVLLIGGVQAQQTSIDNAQTSVYTAYKALVDAYNSRADTSNLLAQLDEAVNLTSQAQTLINSNPQQAQASAAQAQAIAENVTVQALAAKQRSALMAPVTASVLAISLLAGGCLVYFCGPRLFWKMWLRLRKGYHVKIKNASFQNKGFIITWEQVCAVILGLTVIVAFFVAAPFLFPRGSTEQFSELGVLGPNMTLGDYPSEIVAGQTVNFYVYVGNQMARPMYYEVKIKLGDNMTSVGDTSVTPVEQFNDVLPDNGTWTFPVNVTFAKPGLSQRVIFELWIFNDSVNQIQYNDRWGQVWLNVTAPAT